MLFPFSIFLNQWLKIYKALFNGVDAGTIAGVTSIQQQVNQTVNRCMNTEVLLGIQETQVFY